MQVSVLVAQEGTAVKKHKLSRNWKRCGLFLVSCFYLSITL